MSKTSPFQVATLLLISMNILSCSTTASLEPEPDLSRQRSNDNTDTKSRSNNGFSDFLDASGTLAVEIHIVGEARKIDFVEDAMDTVAQMYQQCDIPLETTIRNLPDINTLDIGVEERYALTEQYSIQKPSVFVINSSAERSVGFSYIPKLSRDVSGTAWITGRVSDVCFAWIVAHEIGHVVLNDGSHHPRTSNIMNARCSAGSNYNGSQRLPTWSTDQCRILRSKTNLR